jgi:hypothetical protein
MAVMGGIQYFGTIISTVRATHRLLQYRTYVAARYAGYIFAPPVSWATFAILTYLQSQYKGKKHYFSLIFRNQYQWVIHWQDTVS